MTKLEELVEKLKNLTTIGKKIRFHDKKEKERYYKVGEIIDEVSVLTTDNPEYPDYKHFIQKIITEQGKIRFRICYYTLDAKEKRIVFGQYAAQMSEQDLKQLIQKARKRGFFE